MTNPISHRTSNPTKQFLATCKSLQGGIEQIEAEISPRDLLNSETSNKMGSTYLDIADLFLLACAADSDTAREAVSEARTRAGASSAPKMAYVDASILVPESDAGLDEAIDATLSGLADLVSAPSLSVSSRPFGREMVRPKSVFCFAGDYSVCAHFDAGVSREGLHSPSSLTLTVAADGKVAQSFIQFKEVNRKSDVSTTAELALLVDHFKENREELTVIPA